jgi:hypothetical protein
LAGVAVLTGMGEAMDAFDMSNLLEEVTMGLG